MNGSLEILGVKVRTPTERHLIAPLDLRPGPGDALVITGQSGCGKTM